MVKLIDFVPLLFGGAILVCDPFLFILTGLTGMTEPSATHNKSFNCVLEDASFKHNDSSTIILKNYKELLVMKAFFLSPQYLEVSHSDMKRRIRFCFMHTEKLVTETNKKIGYEISCSICATGIRIK